MAKSKGKKQRLTPSQQRYKKEIANLKKRVKRAEKLGFDFPEEIIPSELPKRITKKHIEELRSLRGEKLYKQAILYEKPEDEFYIEEPLPPSLGIEIIKQKRRERNIANLQKRKRQEQIDEQLVDGLNLLNEYNALLPADQSRFIRALSDDDFEAFTRAQQKYGGQENVRQTDLGTGRQTGEPVLQDERTQYAEDEEGTDEEDYSEPERPVTPTSEKPQRKAFDEEITDEEVKKWRESYEKQKRLPKKEREYIYDGDAIYAGIVNRLMQFQDDYTNDPKRYGGGYSMYKKFKNLLENEIKISGFNTVMKRLDGKGIEIDTALEAMLYDDSEQERKGHPAFMQLAEIITGRAMTQQESAQLAAMSESWGYDTEDNPSYQIDR